MTKRYHTTLLIPSIFRIVVFSFVLFISTLSFSHASFSILKELSKEEIGKIIRGQRQIPPTVSVEEFVSFMESKTKKEEKPKTLSLPISYVSSPSAVYASPLPISYASGEGPMPVRAKVYSLLSIKVDKMLKELFKKSFNQCYNQIEGHTGCKSSKFSLIHWINKGGEDRIFNFSSWSSFRKEPFAWEQADSEMPAEPTQLLYVSKALYKKFLSDCGVQVKDFMDYYGEEVLDS